jgi:hypothetical protein
MPAVALPGAADGAPRALRGVSRDALVLLYLPAAHGDGAEAAQRIAAAADDVEYWYARIVVVVAGDLAAAARVRAASGERLTVLTDEKGELRARIGLEHGQACLLIADRYGEIYEVATANDAAALPGVAEIEEWVKYLATQCPECGVLDQSGHGEWTSGS